MKRRKFGGLILSGLLFGSGGCVDLEEQTGTNGLPEDYDYSLSLDNRSDTQVNVQIDILNNEDGAVYRNSIIVRPNQEKENVFDFDTVEKGTDYVIRITQNQEVSELEFSTDGCMSNPKIIITEDGSLVSTKMNIECEPQDSSDKNTY